MTRLTKTNSGNWAKETTITNGGKWRKCTLKNVPREDAERIAAEHAAKGRKTEIRPGKEGWQVWAYIGQTKQVMQHASREECEAAGVKPGAMND